MLDKIVIKGAREHNLKNIDIEIPKNKFVVNLLLLLIQYIQRDKEDM